MTSLLRLVQFSDEELATAVPLPEKVFLPLPYAFEGCKAGNLARWIGMKQVHFRLYKRIRTGDTVRLEEGDQYVWAGAMVNTSFGVSFHVAVMELDTGQRCLIFPHELLSFLIRNSTIQEAKAA